MSSIIHLYLYGILKRKINGGNIICISQINPILKQMIRIPSKYKQEVINEMIKYGYLTKKSRDNYEMNTISKPRRLSDSLGNPLWD